MHILGHTIILGSNMNLLTVLNQEGHCKFKNQSEGEPWEVQTPSQNHLHILGHRLLHEYPMDIVEI